VVLLWRALLSADCCWHCPLQRVALLGVVISEKVPGVQFVSQSGQLTQAGLLLSTSQAALSLAVSQAIAQADRLATAAEGVWCASSISKEAAAAAAQPAAAAAAAAAAGGVGGKRTAQSMIASDMKRVRVNNSTADAAGAGGSSSAAANKPGSRLGTLNQTPAAAAAKGTAAAQAAKRQAAEAAEAEWGPVPSYQHVQRISIADNRGTSWGIVMGGKAFLGDMFEPLRMYEHSLPVLVRVQVAGQPSSSATVAAEVYCAQHAPEDC
jgi:hypothetical protein